MNSLELPTGSYHFSPEGLRLISKCPLCDEQYQPFQASIVEEKAEAQLVHIKCHRCESSVVALIVNGQFGLTSIGLITDLSSDDVESFKDAVPIEEEDVLRGYQELSANGDKLLSCLKE